jgi:D-alanyl-D-alanine carboxypeptidase
MLSGKSIKFHRANTFSFEKDKRAEEEKKAKLEKMKEINKNYSGPFTPPPKLTAKSYIVCEKGTDSVRPIVCFNSKNSQEVASLTKIMTCIVTIETAHRLKIDVDQE